MKRWRSLLWSVLLSMAIFRGQAWSLKEWELTEKLKTCFFLATCRIYVCVSVCNEINKTSSKTDKFLFPSSGMQQSKKIWPKLLFFQSWQFVKMLIGKLLCGVEGGIWRRLLGYISVQCQIAWLRIIKPQPVPNDPGIWAVQTWEKSNVLCSIADEQELTTANFIIFEIKGYVR